MSASQSANTRYSVSIRMWSKKRFRTRLAFLALTQRSSTQSMTVCRAEETETSITGKLARGAFAVSFFLACLAVLGLTGIDLEDL